MKKSLLNSIRNIIIIIIFIITITYNYEAGCCEVGNIRSWGSTKSPLRSGKIMKWAVTKWEVNEVGGGPLRSGLWRIGKITKWKIITKWAKITKWWYTQ